MIQRVQSIFLLCVTIASFYIVFHPIVWMTMSHGPRAYLSSVNFKLDLYTPVTLYLTFPIAILAILSGLLSFLTILLYQKRLLQMRLCGANILLNIILIVVIFIFYFIIKHKTFDTSITVVSSSFSSPILVPFINIILLFQSFRAIRRDDLLIKSYDRLR
jgi:hypothetical protein